MKCLYCGKKLPMVKKLTSEEFCSAAHRQAYHDEQEQLALARLLEEQQKPRKGRRPLVAAPDPDAPRPAEYLSDQILPRHIGNSPWVSSSSATFAPGLQLPDQIPAPPASGSSLSGPVAVSASIAPQGRATAEDAIAALAAAAAPVDGVAPQIASFSVQALLRQVLPTPDTVAIEVSAEPPPEVQFESAPLAKSANPDLPLSALAPRHQLPLEVFDSTLAAVPQLPFDFAHRISPIAAPAGVPNGSFPAAIALAPLHPQAPAASCQPALATGQATGDRYEVIFAPETSVRPHTADPLPPRPELISVAGSLSEPVLGASLVAAAAVSFELPVGAVPPVPVALPTGADAVIAPPMAAQRTTALDVAEPAVTCFGGAIPRLFARPKPYAPRPSRLTAYPEHNEFHLDPVELRDSRGGKALVGITTGKCEIFKELHQHPEGFLRAVEGHWSASSSLFAFNQPFSPKGRVASIRLSSLSVMAKTWRNSKQIAISVHPDSGSLAPKMKDWIRSSRLPLLRPNPKLAIIPAKPPNPAIAALGQLNGASSSFSWQAVRSRWDHIPNDIRWIAIAVPMVIGLLWFANTPRAQEDARGRISSVVPSVGGLLQTSLQSGSWDDIKRNIRSRAAVELSDDFRQGLGEWTGVGDWASGWTYDPAGFVRPRKMALFSPTMELEDYRFEFLGAIERKALSWVFRAADVKNYYVARLEVTRGGPLPTVELVRYAVVNGRPGPKRVIPLPMQTHEDTIYRIRVDVRGSNFVTTVQDQVVDVFSDNRFSRGGVGFFSEPGEDARLRWVEVSHQYDMLGRLCAYLVPYNVSNSTVRSAP